MARKTVFKPNSNFKEVIQYNQQLADAMQAACEEVAPEGCEVTTIRGKSRARTSIFDPRPYASSVESKHGHLSEALSRISL